MSAGKKQDQHVWLGLAFITLSTIFWLATKKGDTAPASPPTWATTTTSSSSSYTPSTPSTYAPRSTPQSTRTWNPNADPVVAASDPVPAPAKKQVQKRFTIPDRQISQ